MDKYALDKVIGEGSFGRALLVRCKSTRDKYVVKEILLPKVHTHVQPACMHACPALSV